MSQTAFDRLRERLEEIYAELEREMAEKREEFRYSLEQGKIRFQEAAKQHHKIWRRDIVDYLKTAPVRYVLTLPFIYAVGIPLALLDLFASVYQRICFPVYGIPQVKRAEYLLLDRYKLNYLNVIEKLHCEYCSYGNGVLAYVSEIASRTELFWCPIKHAKTPRKYHDRYAVFLDYGDADNYHARLETLRGKVRACEDCAACGEGVSPQP